MKGRKTIINWSYSSNASEFSLILYSFRCAFQSKNTGAGANKMPGIIVCVETVGEMKCHFGPQLEISNSHTREKNVVTKLNFKKQNV